MWRFVLVVALVSGCYAPSPPTGAACSPNGSCPRGLVCAQATLTCELGDVAAPDAARDAAPDVPACMPAAPGMRMLVYTGAIEMFTVPTCGPLTIEAWGAQGGAGFATHVGGKGAHVLDTLTVPKDTVLTILVGGAGIAGANATSQRSGTGGGGTFIVQMQTPLVIAGGGGGGVGGNYSTADGGPGQAGTAGQSGEGTGGAGGINGNGGATYQISNPPVGAYQQGTGGAGFLTDAMGASNGGANFGTPNQPPKAYVNGGAGGIGGDQGRNGGFGGGGSGGFTGAGGGGYSGARYGHHARRRRRWFLHHRPEPGHRSRHQRRQR